MVVDDRFWNEERQGSETVHHWQIPALLRRYEPTRCGSYVSGPVAPVKAASIASPYSTNFPSRSVAIEWTISQSSAW